MSVPLRDFLEVVDEGSYHGEAIICQACLGRGTRAGYKKGVGDEPVKHGPMCPITAKAKLLTLADGFEAIALDSSWQATRSQAVDMAAEIRTIAESL